MLYDKLLDTEISDGVTLVGFADNGGHSKEQDTSNKQGCPCRVRTLVDYGLMYHGFQKVFDQKRISQKYETNLKSCELIEALNELQFKLVTDNMTNRGIDWKFNQSKRGKFLESLN